MSGTENDFLPSMCPNSVPDTLSALSAGCSLFRKLDLPEDIHFRLRMLAYQRGMKLSECAVKVLDKALPKWNVDRIG